MNFRAIVITIFIGLLGFFFENRREIAEELETLAFKTKSQIHTHNPSGRLIMVKMPANLNHDEELLGLMEAVSQKNLKLASFFFQATELTLSQSNLEKLFQILEKNPKFTLGIIGKSKDEPLFQMAPSKILNQLRAAPTSRIYNKDTIISIPTLDDLSGKTRPTLVPWIANKLLEETDSPALRNKLEVDEKEHENIRDLEALNSTKTQSKNLKINYFAPSKLPQITFDEFLNSKDLTNNILFFYSDAFRARIPGGPEANFGHTPWQDKNTKVEMMYSGVPIPFIHAIGLENYLSGNQLKETHPVVNWILTIAACLFAFLIWEYRPDKAVLITLLGAISLILVFSQLESIWGWDIPLSRSILLGCLGSIGGAFHTTSRSVAAKAKALIDSENESAISKVHESILDSLSSKLLRDTDSIIALSENLERNSSLKDNVLLEDLHNCCRELKDYLRDINQFAALRDGSAGLPRKKKTPIRPLIEKIIYQIDPVQKGILVQNHIASDAYLLTDELYLEPILFNLLSNASKYSPRGSTISVFADKNNREIQSITIRDQGPGIADDLKEKVFEKFYRIKDDRAFTVKGSGLGLYLSRFFSDALHLTIQVKDAPGSGSDFIVRRRGR